MSTHEKSKLERFLGLEAKSFLTWLLFTLFIAIVVSYGIAFLLKPLVKSQEEVMELEVRNVEVQRVSFPLLKKKLLVYLRLYRLETGEYPASLKELRKHSYLSKRLYVHYQKYFDYRRTSQGKFFVLPR